MQKYKLKRLFFLLLFPINSVLVYFAKNNTDKIEKIYAQGIYPVLSSAINILTGFAKFSIAEILIFITVIGLIFYITITLVMISQRDKGRKIHAVYVMGVNIVIFFAIINLLFTLMGGLNYYRKTFMEASGIRVNLTEEIPKATPEEVFEIAKEIAQDIAVVSDEVVRDETGNMKLRNTKLETTLITSQQVMSDFAGTYPILRGIYAQPKTLAFSKLFSRFGIKGFIFPFTYEANVNTDIPDHEIPATMMHENSHVRGFMFEDESNFIAYLACIQSQSSDFQYSGFMLGLSYSLDYLYKENVDYYNEIIESLPEEVIVDLMQAAEYWRNKDGVLHTVGNDINDTYLKANNQEEGTDSYSEVLELIVEYHR